MSSCILFFSFAEEAVKDRELNHQKIVFNTLENRSKFWEISFVSLMFSLNEQFELVCLTEIEKA